MVRSSARTGAASTDATATAASMRVFVMSSLFLLEAARASLAGGYTAPRGAPVRGVTTTGRRCFAEARATGSRLRQRAPPGEPQGVVRGEGQPGALRPAE